jgi:signal transduction histidine kinase
MKAAESGDESPHSKSENSQIVSHPENEPVQPEIARTESASDVLAARQAFLQISEEDCRRVQALAPAFHAFAGEFVERFYAHLFSFPHTAAFLEDKELVVRLKGLQRRYFDSLLEANLRPDYVEERRRMGRAHEEVGLEPQWFLGGFNQYIQHCFNYFAGLPGQDLSQYVAGTLSLLKFILLDIGLTLDAYFGRSTEQLRKALNLYEQSNAELSEFAHLASHDLKTPLATVAALCEEFLDEFGSTVPNEARQLIDSARVRTMKMKGLIDELLSMSESAARPGVRTRASARALLDEVLDRVRLEIGERPIRIEIPDQMPEVYTHPGRFREVFYQLLSNAVKFMDKEPGVVRVSAEQSGGEIIFCVADNGPGISEADHLKIFAPFQRLPQHRHRTGSGLGLYFVQKIVAEKGGRVWVESTVGLGCKFYVAIPVEKRS